MTNKTKNILAIEREESKTPSTRQCKWVTLIYFIYFIVSCEDEYSKAQGGSVDPLDLKKIMLSVKLRQIKRKIY
jgi:hypothetical protein